MIEISVAAIIFAAVAAPTNAPPTVLIISALIGAVFGTGGIIALITARRQNKKLDAESHKLQVEADILPIDLARGAVVVQSDVIKDLRAQIEQQDQRIREHEHLLEKERRKHDSAEKRADEAYQRLDLKCTKQAELLAGLQERFVDMLGTMDKLTSENQDLKRARAERA